MPTHEESKRWAVEAYNEVAEEEYTRWLELKDTIFIPYWQARQRELLIEASRLNRLHESNL